MRPTSATAATRDTIRGGVIRARRSALRLSQQELAQALGVQTANVSHWENNRQGITWDVLQRLADALQSSPQELIEPPPSSDGGTPDQVVGVEQMVAAITLGQARLEQKVDALLRAIELDPAQVVADAEHTAATYHDQGLEAAVAEIRDAAAATIEFLADPVETTEASPAPQPASDATRGRPGRRAG